jgi:hypothetical protein
MNHPAKKNKYPLPDLSNLSACVNDSRDAWRDNDPGPQDPVEYDRLCARLIPCKEAFPLSYCAVAFDPFSQALKQMGRTAFDTILRKDPKRERLAGLLFDIAQTILQRGEGYNTRQTDAFQEVISDLYDGFLSAEDRHHIKKPDYEVIPPLVKWGNPGSGPYTWPVGATRSFGLETATVNLPPSHGKKCLFGWAALGHETGGHDILGADKGLEDELAQQVGSGVKEKKLGQGLAEYWMQRIGETASDILGILNIGPAAALGMIGYFRGWNDAFGNGTKLSNEDDGTHPCDIIRGYLAASAIRLLTFDGAAQWADCIEAEVRKDTPASITLAETNTSFLVARRSAAVAAAVLINGKMDCLEGHALGEIQNWHNEDEKIVVQLQEILTKNDPLPEEFASGMYAAHVVAAATVAGAKKNANVTMIFDRMLTVLQTMHKANPAWSQTTVVHPGDLLRRYARPRMDS